MTNLTECQIEDRKDNIAIVSKWISDYLDIFKYRTPVPSEDSKGYIFHLSVLGARMLWQSMSDEERLELLSWEVNDYVNLVAKNNINSETFNDKLRKLLNEIEVNCYEEAYKHFAQQEV